MSFSIQFPSSSWVIERWEGDMKVWSHQAGSGEIDEPSAIRLIENLASYSLLDEGIEPCASRCRVHGAQNNYPRYVVGESPTYVAWLLTPELATSATPCGALP